MQSWLGLKLMRKMMGELNAGNPKPVLMLDSRKVELTFPGESSWSGTFTGKKEVKKWLERFAISGLQIFADEVVIKGTPLRGTVCVRGTDHLDTADGERVYANRYVIWGHLRWGKLRRYEVYEDTAKAVALDEWMERTGSPASASKLGIKRRRHLRKAA